MQETTRSFCRRGKISLERQSNHPDGVPGEMLVMRGVFLRKLLISPAKLYHYFSPYSSFALMPAVLVLRFKPGASQGEKLNPRSVSLTL